MTTRYRQAVFGLLLALPLLSHALLSSPLDARSQGPRPRLGTGYVGPANPILVDTSGDGVPTEGVDQTITPSRIGNDITVRSPWDCNANDTDNRLTLGNPDGQGRFQRLSRFDDRGYTQQVDISTFFLPGRPNGYSYLQKDLDGKTVGTGTADLVDTNNDRVLDTLHVGGNTERRAMNVALSLVTADVNNDGMPDYLTVPWAQAAAFGMLFAGDCTVPSANASQIWIPMGDSDGDGVRDSIVPDLDGNGSPDADAFISPVLAAGTPNLPYVGFFMWHTMSIPEAEGSPLSWGLPVSLNGASSQPVTVQYQTVALTATAGQDFTATSGTLTFNSGVTALFPTVPILPDTVFEGEETFLVTLSNPTNAAIAYGNMLVTITDDVDVGMRSVKVNNPPVVEGNSGNKTLDFVVSLNARAPVLGGSVNYTTVGGTATAGDDFVTKSGTLNFGLGEIEKTVSVVVNGDTTFEPNETILLNLSAPTNLLIADAQGVGSIVNDDQGTAALAINDVSQAEGNAGTSDLTFMVTLTSVAAQPVTVQYATADGTATAATDYTATSGTLTFAAGETTKPVVVPIVGDTGFEATETFVVNLSNPSANATIGDAQGVGTIANDDTLTAAINDVSVTEGHAGATPATFTVTLSAPSLGGVTIDYATADGTATAGTDYTATTGTLTFGPGETTKTAEVSVLGDTSPEANETFVMNLSNGVNVTLADAQGMGTIADDDRRLYVLAEGATGPFFDTNILLANPNGVPVPLTITFAIPTTQAADGTAARPRGTVTQNVTLPATSRTTLAVDEIAGLENTAFSTLVDALGAQKIVVERTMYWDGTRYGGHTDAALNQPSPTWYFAEGSQGFFDTYLLLGNLNTVAAHVTVRFLREDGVVVTQTLDMPGEARATLYVGGIPELVGRSFAITVAADQPISAERSMYFGTTSLFDGGHNSAGQPAPATSWFHAEGATGPFFDTFILVGNPNTDATEVTFTFLRPTGAPIVRQRLLPGNTRLTLNVEDVDPLLADTAVSTMITSTLPVVTERSQYWAGPYTAWYEGHTSFGVSSLGKEWGLAEGEVGGPLGYETYLLLSNPGTADAAVTVTYLRTNGTTVVKSYLVGANTRRNVWVNGEVPELANEAFGALVQSTNGVSIAVDRSMYWTVGGQAWAGGTSASGTKLQ